MMLSFTDSSSLSEALKRSELQHAATEAELRELQAVYEGVATEVCSQGERLEGLVLLLAQAEAATRPIPAAGPHPLDAAAPEPTAARAGSRGSSASSGSGTVPPSGPTGRRTERELRAEVARLRQQLAGLRNASAPGVYPPSGGPPGAEPPRARRRKPGGAPMPKPRRASGQGTLSEARCSQIDWGGEADGLRSLLPEWSGPGGSKPALRASPNAAVAAALAAAVDLRDRIAVFVRAQDGAVPDGVKALAAECAALRKRWEDTSAEAASAERLSRQRARKLSSLLCEWRAAALTYSIRPLTSVLPKLKPARPPLDWAAKNKHPAVRLNVVALADYDAAAPALPSVAVSPLSTMSSYPPSPPAPKRRSTTTRPSPRKPEAFPPSETVGFCSPVHQGLRLFLSAFCTDVSLLMRRFVEAFTLRTPLLARQNLARPPPRPTRGRQPLRGSGRRAAAAVRHHRGVRRADDNLGSLRLRLPISSRWRRGREQAERVVG
ncbi:hypothetical protein DIPPA_30198 [Diplonema papillatum]|nr:hypothetical protein DIPPA_30198 [Diplonema papillatum]